MRFTAAQCGANILINRSDGDARFYLPPNYPFFVEDILEETVRGEIEYVQDRFNQAEWRYGLESMARVRQHSSARFVYQELERFLAQVRTSELSTSISHESMWRL